MDKAINKAMCFNGVDLQTNELKLKFKVNVDNYHAKLKYEISSSVKGVSKFSVGFNELSLVHIQFLNIYISDCLSAVLSWPERHKIFFNEKEADYTGLFTKLFTSNECMPVHYWFVIYLAKLDFDN